MSSRKRTASAKRHIAAPGLDRLAVISAELDMPRQHHDASAVDAAEAESGYGLSPGAEDASGHFNHADYEHPFVGDRDSDETAPTSKRRRVDAYCYQRQDYGCTADEESRAMSMYLQRSMQQLSQLNADLSVLWPIIHSKQFSSCREHNRGRQPRSATARIGSGPPQHGDNLQDEQELHQAQLGVIYGEVLRLKGTVEAVVGQPIGIPVATTLVDAQFIVKSLGALQSTLDAFQQQTYSEPNIEQVTSHTGTTLDHVWMESRVTAEEEIRAKLYLWKYKAVDLKESLRATIERRREAMRAVSGHGSTTSGGASNLVSDDHKIMTVMNSALEFVSSLYLLEMVNDPATAAGGLKRERVLADAAKTLCNKIGELEIARRKSVTLPDLSFETASSVPMANPYPSAPAPGLFDSNFSDASDPPEEDEPLPVLQPNAAMAYEESSTPTAEQTGAAAGTPPPSSTPGLLASTESQDPGVSTPTVLTPTPVSTLASAAQTLTPTSSSTRSSSPAAVPSGVPFPSSAHAPAPKKRETPGSGSGVATSEASASAPASAPALASASPRAPSPSGAASHLGTGTESEAADAYMERQVSRAPPVQPDKGRPTLSTLAPAPRSTSKQGSAMASAPHGRQLLAMYSAQHGAPSSGRKVPAIAPRPLAQGSIELQDRQDHAKQIAELGWATAPRMHNQSSEQQAANTSKDQSSVYKQPLPAPPIKRASPAPPAKRAAAVSKGAAPSPPIKNAASASSAKRHSSSDPHSTSGGERVRAPASSAAYSTSSISEARAMVAAARVAKQSANRPNAARVHELMTSMTPIQPRPSLTGEPPNILQRRRAPEKQDSRDSTLAKTSPASVDASARPTSSRSSTSSGCSVCHKNNSFDELLLCDNECGREFHTFCLTPALEKIPEGDWYCPHCISSEQVENGDIFKCSAANCDKITGARYCSLHRCRQPNCLNRIKAGGFCRRHEIYRVRPKRVRPSSNASPVLSFALHKPFVDFVLRAMSRKTMGDLPGGIDAPTFTCEVCKISVRSAQKLLDHVNFSPLHKAALEGGGKLVTGTDSAASVSVGQRRLLYDGTKLFWRINETLELCIYEDTGAYSVTVMAFRQDPVQQVPQQAVTPVVLDSLRLRKVLGLQVSAAFDPNEANSAELMSKFVLSRLQAKRDEGGATSLYLQPLHDGEPDPMLLLHRQGNGLHAQLAFPADLSVRRRHTIDDVKEAEQGVKTAAAELRHARQQAESFSQLARISLEAFSRRHSPSKPDESKRRTSDWSRVYDRVALQNAVDRNRDAVSSFERRKE